MTYNPDEKVTLDRQISDADTRKAQKAPAQPAQVFGKKRVHGTRNTPKRTRQIMTRLDDREYALFCSRLARTNLPQGEYVRQMILKGEITVIDQSELLTVAIDLLSDIRAILGKQNGMIKMIVRPNEGQRQLAPREWEYLIHTLRDIERTLQMITDIKRLVKGE